MKKILLSIALGSAAQFAIIEPQDIKKEAEKNQNDTMSIIINNILQPMYDAGLCLKNEFNERNFFSYPPLKRQCWGEALKSKEVAGKFGWTFDKDNTFDLHELVLIERSNKNEPITYGIITSKYEREGQPDSYEVFLYYLGGRQYKRPVSAASIGKYREPRLTNIQELRNRRLEIKQKEKNESDSSIPGGPAIDK